MSKFKQGDRVVRSGASAIQHPVLTVSRYIGTNELGKEISTQFFSVESVIQGMNRNFNGPWDDANFQLVESANQESDNGEIPRAIHTNINTESMPVSGPIAKLPMTPAEYLAEFEKITAKMLEITRKKNADYTGQTKDAFSNFRVVEHTGLTSVEVGILTRMSDKFARAVALTRVQASVSSESIQDTLLDLANYAIILSIYLSSKDSHHV